MSEADGWKPSEADQFFERDCRSCQEVYWGGSSGLFCAFVTNHAANLPMWMSNEPKIRLRAIRAEQAMGCQQFTEIQPVEEKLNIRRNKP